MPPPSYQLLTSQMPGIKQPHYIQQPSEQYSTVISSPYPSSTAPIPRITSRHFSPTGQTHHIQQPSEQYQYPTTMSPPYPLSTPPIPRITSRHFSPTGQARHIQQPSAQYSTIISLPYPSMNASNFDITVSYLSIFASPHCYFTGQAHQNIQQITEQHHATMSISPLPAINMTSHSMSQSSMTSPDDELVSKRPYRHYHPDTTPILDSHFPGQTDFPGSSTSAKSFALSGRPLIANSPNDNTTNQYTGYGVSFHNPSFHSSQYHNTVKRNNIPLSSSLPTPHSPQNVPPNTNLASSSSYPESFAHDFGTQHSSQPAGLPYQPALHVAPSPSIHSQDPSRCDPLVYLSSGCRRKTHTQEIRRSSSTTFHCDWLDENNELCEFEGSLGDLKKHVTSKHLLGAQNASNRCHWQGCEYQKRADPTVHDMRRDSTWRHVQEKHLKMKRKKKRNI